MENQNNLEELDKLLDEPIEIEPEPIITFHVFAGELWFWRIAVPIALVCSLITLLK